MNAVKEHKQALIELENKVAEIVKQQPGIKFSEIRKHFGAGEGPTRLVDRSSFFRKLDRALQSLRKKGLVRFDNGWHPKESQ